MRKKINYFILLLFVFSACSFNSIYEQAIEIPKMEWDKSFVAKFDIPIKDTINGYNIIVTIRNTNDYPYSNFHLFVSSIAPNGNIKKDTIELFLADEHGKWFGSGLGGIWESEHMYKKNIRFPLSGNYRIELVHAMRDSNLKGMKDIGFKVEKTNE